jgi:hypothetical protein
MPDEKETENGTNPNDSCDADTDAEGDGLLNGELPLQLTHYCIKVLMSL